MQRHGGEEAKGGWNSERRGMESGQRRTANAPGEVDSIQGGKDQSPTRVSKPHLQTSGCSCNFSLCTCQRTRELLNQALVVPFGP